MVYQKLDPRKREEGEKKRIMNYLFVNHVQYIFKLEKDIRNAQQYTSIYTAVIISTFGIKSSRYTRDEK